jgi:hypothetical protein
MSQKITLHQYDNGIKLLLTIRKDGVIEPLNGAKVLIKFRNKSTGYEFDRYATITDANNAECEYVFTEEDLSVPGGYVTEVETTYSNGTVISTFNPLIVVIQTEIHNRTEK